MTKFNGFSSPTHTQTPQEFFEIVASKGITIAEVKILAFMIRETFGWQKGGHSLRMAFKDIMKATNLKKEAVNNGIHKCLEKGYIERAEMLGEIYYRIKLADEDPNQGVWEVAVDWQNNHKTKVIKAEPIKIEGKLAHKQVRKSNHNSGSEIEPTAVRKSNQQRFGNRTNSGSEIEPINNGQSQAIQGIDASRKKGLKKDLNKALNKNNNNKRSTKGDPNPSKGAVSLSDYDVVVDTLTKYGIKFNKKTIKNWLSLDCSENVLQAIETAIKRPDVKNVVGYVTRTLEQGYTEPTPSKHQGKGLPEWVVRQSSKAIYTDKENNELTNEQKDQAEQLLRALGEID